MDQKQTRMMGLPGGQQYLW